MTSSVKLGGAAGTFAMGVGAPLMGGDHLLSISVGALGLLATAFLALEARDKAARESAKELSR